MWSRGKTIEQRPKRLSLPALTALVLLGLAIPISLLQFRAPPPSAADAPPDEFSAARAMDALALLAHTPHPLGFVAVGCGCEAGRRGPKKPAASVRFG